MKLKDFRKSRGMTQMQFAAELECSPSAISKWERSVDTVPLYITQKIKNKFGVDIDATYSQFDLLKQRIKDLEDENAHLVTAGILLQKEIDRLNDTLAAVATNLEQNIELIKTS